MALNTNFNASVGSILPPWSPGTLDIHFIDTGVGNAAFVIGPDATTILIDCGATRGGPPASTPLRPNQEETVGQIVSRYALRHAAPAKRTTLNYMIATHVHPDHVGNPIPSDKLDPGGYYLTGLSEIDSLMPADLVIDRGFPTYDPLPTINAPFATNHIAWLQSRINSGKRVEQVSVGSDTQLTPRNTPNSFQVRFIGGNGEVWTGNGTSSHSILAPPTSWTSSASPEENHMSIALTLSYAGFRLFTGGDIVADTQDGAYPWLDVETPIVEAAGEVDVATADHHGYFDACFAGFTKALNATSYVVQAWHATHPAMDGLQRMLNAWPGREGRDVFITRLDPASEAVNARFLKSARSVEGNVVVRVGEDGRYRVFVTDSRDEEDRVTFVGDVRTAKGRGG
ncbi:hypothetical protein BU24DRAFT_473357 [Aaosphaeria arxii CBS 175.79]|uniref:Metallo-beta-lactamase domain-containing protein n=1 Tax=Aaosphaeria arxii CBS 175.79 TaxID=1450172 RepID=A0A6A5XB91_9PLEO|nr:uncharacterized protein BU24DRAFT_473357 [Aaosphaeria arxii CBS 175.79]KAF2010180.1 hypothetical protein BU24DRAFT_473357 [Aaosphaeria arxii CBS 175.79]